MFHHSFSDRGIKMYSLVIIVLVELDLIHFFLSFIHSTKEFSGQKLHKK